MKLIISILILATVLIAGCTTETEDQESIEATFVDKIEILNHKMEYGEFGNLMVVGTAKNNADERLSYVEIRVRFYDENNTLLDSSLDNINDLNAGQTWEFEVHYNPMDVGEVDHYDIDALRVFL